MKIAMIGSGAAGSVFASYLRRGGADMTLVDVYKAHMDKVAADGMTFRIDPDQSYHLDGFKTAYSADEIGIMDAVIFLTKATQLENAIIGAAPCIGPETVVISLINGLGNEDKLLKYHPANRCMIGSAGCALPCSGLPRSMDLMRLSMFLQIRVGAAKCSAPHTQKEERYYPFLLKRFYLLSSTLMTARPLY